VLHNFLLEDTVLNRVNGASTTADRCGVLVELARRGGCRNILRRGYFNVAAEVLQKKLRLSEGSGIIWEEYFWCTVRALPSATPVRWRRLCAALRSEAEWVDKTTDRFEIILKGGCECRRRVSGDAGNASR